MSILFYSLDIQNIALVFLLNNSHCIVFICKNVDWQFFPNIVGIPCILYSFLFFLFCFGVPMQAISLRELEDVTSLEEKLGRSLSKEERNRIGVSSLRLFLEELLQERYRGSPVPSN